MLSKGVSCFSIGFKRVSTPLRAFSTGALSQIEEAEIERKRMLLNIYKDAFSGLDASARLRLAKSGEVWWKYANFENREVDLPSSLEKGLQALDIKQKIIKDHDSLDDPSSPVWYAFRLAMTHNSTAIEGNKLNIGQTKLVIDEFAVGISQGLGMSEYENLGASSAEIKKMPRKDVSEIVNHAAAMEFARKRMFGKPLDLPTIVEAHKILMPDLVSEMSVIGLDDDSHVFRKVPIHVRGSPVVRPYGHEVPAVMEKLLHLHFNQRHQHHPLVCNTLFFMNFLMIHPFADGNGRLARLLLFVLQHNAGYYGLMFHVADRAAFFKLFTPYYTRNDVLPILDYTLENNAELLDKLALYENTLVMPSF